jgi:endonuclease/exonuclease/phosphatase family metal-dependent hydrolase
MKRPHRARDLRLAASLLACGSVLTSAALGQPGPAGPVTGPVTIRVATFNLEDVRTTDLVNGSQPRLRALAEVVQRIRPNVLFLNELAFDMEGAPGFRPGSTPGQNAQRFLDLYVHHPQLEGAPAPIRYRVFVAPSNTGLASGFDLNNDGVTTTTYPVPPGADDAGNPGPQTAEGRAFGEDCWGFGTFPGQYAMALLVDERLEILADRARTFQRLPWDYMPGAYLPTHAAAATALPAPAPTPAPPTPSSPTAPTDATSPDPSPAAPSVTAPTPPQPRAPQPTVPQPGAPWFADDERALFRLSSKSHWDVPIKLPNGSVVHILCSHPTPPAFDGPELRNKKRNYDEIRFWADYINQQSWIVDDAGVAGGLIDFASFIIVGDLNADPDEGTSFKDPIGTLIRPIRRVNMGFTPMADVAIPRLDPDDTAMFGLRVDYVIPSADLDVRASGVYRTPPTLAPKPGTFPSDHFPVWVDLTIRPPGG